MRNTFLVSFPLPQSLESFEVIEVFRTARSPLHLNEVVKRWHAHRASSDCGRHAGIPDLVETNSRYERMNVELDSVVTNQQFEVQEVPNRYVRKVEAERSQGIVGPLRVPLRGLNEDVDVESSARIAVVRKGQGPNHDESAIMPV